MRQCENNMEVRHRQQFSGTRSQPLGPCVSLALGAVPVAAGVVRDDLMSAAAALIAMAAQSRRAAASDGVKHLAMLPGQMGSVPFPITVARCANDVGHLEGGPIHRLLRLSSLRPSRGAAMESVSSGLGTASRWRRERCR